MTPRHQPSNIGQRAASETAKSDFSDANKGKNLPKQVFSDDLVTF
jgi:hypothetical protein